MPENDVNSRNPVSSIKGFQIRWYKKTKLSQVEKQKIKKDLHELSDKINAVMNCTKEEDSRNEVAEVRFPLPSLRHLKAYLTIEYCNYAWHLMLETYADCIGEIVSKGGPFIQMLKSDEVEEESL